MIPFIVGIFALVQVFFTAADMYTVWRQGGKPSWREIWKSQSRTILAISLFWVIYFFIQTAGVALVPGVSDAADFLRAHMGFPVRPSHIGFAEVMIVFALHVWTYFSVSFWDYVTHRWVLHHRWFWLFHEYHHVPKQVYNGMPGISVRPFVFATTILTYAGSLLFLWWPLKNIVSPDAGSLFVITIPIMIFSLTLVLSIGHSIWLRPYKTLHRSMKLLGIATPQEHILHHSKHLRVNYGNFSCIWDHLFGTYLDPEKCDFENEPLGLDYDQDFLGALCLGRVKIPRRAREGFGLGDYCHFD